MCTGKSEWRQRPHRSRGLQTRFRKVCRTRRTVRTRSRRILPPIGNGFGGGRRLDLGYRRPCSRILRAGGGGYPAVTGIRKAPTRSPDLRLCRFDRRSARPSHRIAWNEGPGSDRRPKKGRSVGPGGNGKKTRRFGSDAGSSRPRVLRSTLSSHAAGSESDPGERTAVRRWWRSPWRSSTSTGTNGCFRSGPGPTMKARRLTAAPSPAREVRWERECPPRRSGGRLEGPQFRPDAAGIRTEMGDPNVPGGRSNRKSCGTLS